MVIMMETIRGYRSDFLFIFNADAEDCFYLSEQSEPWCICGISSGFSLFAKEAIEMNKIKPSYYPSSRLNGDTTLCL